MCCVIRSPHTCWRTERTCASCRRCSATPTSRRRRFTRTSRQSASRNSTRDIIREADAYGSLAVLLLYCSPVLKLALDSLRSRCIGSLAVCKAIIYFGNPKGTRKAGDTMTKHPPACNPYKEEVESPGFVKGEMQCKNGGNLRAAAVLLGWGA